MSVAVEKVVAALRASGCNPRQFGKGWKSCCPAHDDSHPSLDINTGDNGKALLFCQSAGCPAKDIVKAIGLTMQDLFVPEYKPIRGNSQRRKHYGTPAEAVEAARWQVAQSQAVRIAEVHHAHTWIYRRQDSSEAFRVARFDVPNGKEYRPIHHASDGWCIADPPGKLPLYRLPDLAGPDPVIMVEGEVVADAAIALGLTATTSAHGSKSPSRTDWTPLAGRKVLILPDNDDPGRKYGAEVAAILCGLDPPATVKMLNLPWLKNKADDLVQFIQNRRDDGRDDAAISKEIGRLSKATEPWKPEKVEHTNRLASSTPPMAASAGASTNPHNTQRDLSELNATDMGNAERFNARHGTKVRYTNAHGWLIWGQRWRCDDSGEAMRRAKDTARAIYDEAAKTENEDRRKELFKLALRSEHISRVKAMLELAQSEPGIALRPEDFDNHPRLFNFDNGTLNLESGVLRPHDPADLITKIRHAPYDPQAQSDLWDEFLRKVTAGYAGLLEFLQRCVGYSMTGDTREERLFFVHGPEATGKSTFMEAIKKAFGEYSTTADFNTFLARKHDGPSNDIARLLGARLVSSIEVADGKKLAEGLIKQITGGDTIACRRLYQEAFEYKPEFKLWLVANHRPRVDASDGAIWRRILLIPFTNVVPEADRDPDLKLRLTTDPDVQAAILAWAVKGCLAWQKDGLDIPECVKAATKEYRTAEDIVAHFISDCCTIGTGEEVGGSTLYRSYKSWCEETGERPMTQTMFGRRLTDRGLPKDPNTRPIIRLGISLRSVGLRSLVDTITVVDRADDQNSPTSPEAHAGIRKCVAESLLDAKKRGEGR